jgi:2-phosphosulfolactate phosphatase
VLFTTTNGTRALAHAREAERVLVGSAVNRERIVRVVANAPRIDILCAGTDGQVTGEDILTAGSMVDQLLELNPDWQLNAPATEALSQWQTVVARAKESGNELRDELAVALRDTAGGKNLLGAGLAVDLVVCAKLDSLDVLPELNRTTRQITLR